MIDDKTISYNNKTDIFIKSAFILWFCLLENKEKVINSLQKSFNTRSLKLAGQLKLIVDKIGDNDGA